MRTSLLSLLCILFVLQSVFANAVSGHNMRMLNAQNQQHVLVICTGIGIKWINSDVYFATGNIVEVEQPNSANENELNLACFSSLALEHNPLLDNFSEYALNAIAKNSKRISFTQLQSYHARSYLQPAPRAPPVIYLI
ncbi:hypothetical protein [Glaciecola sp. SC05]|uniref:hypothetical protein n=1 Tax=Glaciecola sp. SC05 TaxID=1987355 RepID=UPI0035295ACF